MNLLSDMIACTLSLFLLFAFKYFSFFTFNLNEAISIRLCNNLLEKRMTLSHGAHLRLSEKQLFYWDRKLKIKNDTIIGMKRKSVNCF